VDRIRKALAAVFAVVGAYYCVLGVFTLARLPDVTRQWIAQSGDPEVKYDYGLFMMLGGIGATSIAVLGWRTVVKGLATARGRHASWLGPAVAALPLHWFWFLHRVMGAGYVVLWVITRRPSSSGPANIRLQPAAGGAIQRGRG